MSDTIRITLPDGSIREVAAGTTGFELAESIGKRLAKDAIGITIDGVLHDLRRPLRGDATIQILTAKDELALEVLRHSMAHTMAQAVMRVFPGASLAIGPTVADGFYYDVLLDHAITPEDLSRVEQEMGRVVKENLTIERFVRSRDDALAWATEHGQGFKSEIISDLPDDEEISFYRQGDFTDLCSGPHVMRTGQLGHAFRLMKVAGAYWRGDETREQLQRIYGTAWFESADLEAYLTRLEEAQKRDHRRLGRDLDLFSFHEEAPAMPFFHPRGALVYNLLIDYVRDLYKTRGYDEVITPQVLDVGLWHRSGHYENYRESMFFATFDESGEGEPEFAEPTEAVKPMNCPTHCLIFATSKKSYRDLPVRYADFGRLHRYERSGVTAGLFRVRSFAQDDAHIFCTSDQIESEVTAVTEMLLECYRTFGFGDEVLVHLSTRPAKSIGSDEVWNRAEASLRSALEKMGVPFKVSPGEGAFYGPKIDFSVRDALRRYWQLGTCQLDFSLPERFDLRFTTPADKDERPVMIHRAMLGSLERFLGVLIEHTAGDLPLWLAPEQVRVVSITDAQSARAEQLCAQLRAAGLRAQADVRNEKMGLKVRDASLAKVRYQLIIGARESERGTVSVRHRTDGDLGEMDLDRFQAVIRKIVAEKQ